MPTALFLSPHLDDVVFSCGGLVARLAKAGWTCRVVTVFTASVPEGEKTPFAMACQTDKGFAPADDYMAHRRAEDEAACVALGALPGWWTLREAPHRGYGTPEALFGEIREDDARTWQRVAERLHATLARVRPHLVGAPLGLGGHVDHRHVVRAVADADAEAPVAWYRDTPYAMRAPEALAAPEAPAGLHALPIVANGTLDAKLDACAAYASQLSYQFGRDAGGGYGGSSAITPAETARSRLRAFARDEGTRFGAPGPAEVVFAADPERVARLFA